MDDDPDTLEILARLLGRRGHSTVCVSSSAAALTACAEGPFDLLICDIGLPETDGWSLLPQLKSKCIKHAIALSGHAYPADIERSMAAGFDRHLTKPCDVEKILASIAALFPPPPPLAPGDGDGRE